MIVTQEMINSIQPGLEFSFHGPYDQYADRLGQHAIVVAPVPQKLYDYEECGELYYIQFDDNDIIEAWPEEIA